LKIGFPAQRQQRQPYKEDIVFWSEWKCNDLNESSRRAAERFGFTFEGIFRQNYVFKNCNRNTAWFSIIDSEWPTLKEKFEKWLHPNNFSASGKQILKLAEIYAAFSIDGYTTILILPIMRWPITTPKDIP
jgi:hypothetical protein